MDEESFDRLSVVVHRVRDKATRRGVLGFVLGGSVAAVSGRLTGDAGARKRNRSGKNKDCHGYGGPCGSSKDCCYSTCRSGRCRYGGGGRRSCGGTNCDAGWGCCNFRGVSVCVPRNYPVCCGNRSFANGYTCCGGSGGACVGGVDSCTGQFGVCCQSGTRYCNHGFFKGQCIPKGWDCDDLSQSSQSGGISADSTEQPPVSDPMPISPEDWVDLKP